MTLLNMDQIKVIAAIDDALQKAKHDVDELAQVFRHQINNNPKPGFTLEELNPALDKITKAASDLRAILRPGIAPTKQVPTKPRRGHRHDYNGEQLTASEIADRHPEKKRNTIINRLAQGYSPHEAVHGRARKVRGNSVGH